MKSFRKLLTASVSFAAGTLLASGVLAAQLQQKAETVVVTADSPQKMRVEPLSIDRIAADPDLWGVTISRDGKYVAGLASIPNENPVIRIWKTEDLSKPPIQYGSKAMRFTSVTFVKNDMLLVQANQPKKMGGAGMGRQAGSVGSRWVSKIAFADIKNNKFLDVNTSFTGFGILSTMPSDPDHILVEGTDIDTDLSGAMKFNIRTMNSQLVNRSGEDYSFSVASGATDTITASGVVDAEGNIRMRRGLFNIGGDWYEKFFWREPKGEWVELTGLTSNLKNRFAVDIISMSKDGYTLLVETNRDTNYNVVAKYDVRTHQLSAPIFKNTEYDTSGVAFWRPQDSDAPETEADDTPSGYCWSGPTRECIYTEPTLQRQQALLESAMPGKIVTFRPRQSGKITLVTANAPNAPAEYFVLKDEKQLVRLGSNMEGIDRGSFGPGQWVVYKARDGLDIPSLLYLPPGYNKNRDGRLPLVVMPHGGPWSRDSYGWDRSNWSQMFATRGFAVLLPNYRGSTGLGMKHWKAGDKEWGAKMQDDKDDGAKWLVEQGIVDPNRMMMYGYSYGGFAAAAAAARSGSASKGLWQCAIAGAPAIDLARIGNDWGDSRIQRIVQGSTVDGWDPMKHLNEVEIPWMIFHGDYDRQADTIHSRTAAQKIGQMTKAKFTYEEIPEMSHQLIQMTPDHRRFFTAAIFDWMDKDCGNISASFSEPSAKGIYESTKNKLKVKTISNR